MFASGFLKAVAACLAAALVSLASASATPAVAAGEFEYFRSSTDQIVRVYSKTHAYMGYVRVESHPKHRKHFLVCDIAYDGAGPGIQIELPGEPGGTAPGAGAPLTYWDTTGGDSGCLDRDVWHRIVRWRPVGQRNVGVPYKWGIWERHPLPYAGY